MSVKSRLEKLEEIKEANTPTVIIVRGLNGDLVTVNGEQMTEEEAHKRYPGEWTVLKVKYEDQAMAPGKRS